MKTINFYKKAEKIFSVYAESLEDVLNNPGQYFQGYTQDMIITDVAYQYPIFINDKLREMTKEEKVRDGIQVSLEPGEIIRDRKIIRIEKPQKNEKYLSWNKEKEKWEFDSQKEYEDYITAVDNLKAEVLAYGFDYDGHRQKCRNKDITFMVSTITALNVAKKRLNKELKAIWYFEDNTGKAMTVEELEMLMISGTMFVQSVFNTENYFKTQVGPKNLTKEEFESKVKELHNVAMTVSS